MRYSVSRLEEEEDIYGVVVWDPWVLPEPLVLAPFFDTDDATMTVELLKILEAVTRKDEQHKGKWSHGAPA